MKQVREVILFCDMRGFARLALGLGDRMPAFVQAFYEAMGDEIVGGGGTIIKYIGDAMLAVFPDGAERQAVAAALAMRRAMASLAGRWKLDAECQLQVGVSAGMVARGQVGHRSLHTDDVLGEAVNEAAVLTHFPGVAVTEPIRAAIEGAFATEPLPDTPLKWRSEPLRAWRIVEG